MEDLMNKILLIGDSRDCPNYGAIGTTEMLLKEMRELNYEIKTISWRSLNSATPVDGWKQTASESIANFKYGLHPETIKERLQERFADTFLMDEYHLVKKRIKKVRGRNNGFDIHKYHVPYRYEDYEDFSQKVIAGLCLQYEKQMLEWADIVVINGEGSIVKGTDKNGYYHLGGLYVLFLAYLSKKVFKKETYMINHTVDPQNRDIFYMISKVYPLLDGVYVREPLSLRTLKEYCDYDKAVYVPDALFSFEADDAWHPTSYIDSIIDFSKPYICIGDSSGFYTDTNNLFDVEKMYDELIPKLKKICPQVIFIVGFGKYYSPVMKAIRNNNIPFLCIHNSSYVDLFHVLKGAEIFISGRWHTSILALKAKTPILLFGSDSHKTEALYKMINYPYRFFDFRTLRLHTDDIALEAEKIINADHENSFLLAEQLGQAAKRNTEFMINNRK